MKNIVIIQECANGNDQVGDMWNETFVCDEFTTIKEVLEWKNKLTGRGGRLMITKATVQDEDVPF